MFSPGFEQVPAAAGEAIAILRGVLVRCAQAGLLAVDPDLAAQEIMAANVGVALSLIAQPHRYRDPQLSARVRDALHRDVLTPEAFAHRPSRAATLAPAANQLSALLARDGDPPLTQAETQLLQQWLHTLATHRAED